MAIKIRSGDEAAYGRQLALKSSVERSEQALAFDPSRAADPQLFVEGEEFYPPMLDDLRRAESSIHIIQFGIRPGSVADRLTKILIDRAVAGVPVRMIVDSRGSRPDFESSKLFDRLSESGVEVFVNRPFAPRVSYGPLGSPRGSRWNVANLLAVDHRKVIVIDGRICWLGTAGIEDRFLDGRHHDLFVRLEGPVLHQFQAVFLASYRWHGGELPVDEVSTLFPDPPGGDCMVPAMVLHNAPGKFRPIARGIVDLISSSRRSLDIMNPYVADPGMFRLMIDAAERGVRVRLIVPPLQSTLSTGYARLYHYAELIDAGVEVWTYPTVAHAKAFVSDGENVLVGSCNLETWSLRRFFEIDVSIRSPDLADQFRSKLFEPDIVVSTPARPAKGIRERVLSTAFYLVSPLL